jgi:replicative DNA helicase
MTAAPNEKRGNREQEISSISRALKSLAKELHVPVIALSQLSRSVETRGGEKRPMLSDLRESGAIEQDADIVTFIYRPGYYENADPTVPKDETEIIIAKHRNGGLDTVKLRFIGEFTKFENSTTDNFMGGDGSNNPFSTANFSNTMITVGSRLNTGIIDEDNPSMIDNPF